MPNFTAGQAELTAIRRIARRALDTIPALRAEGVLSFDLQRELEACHCNGCPLRLTALLKADEYSFAREISGIRRHLNRNTGRLDAAFTPYFRDAGAARSAA